ncbi:MAG: archease [Nitrospira sp.]|nr:archease [Nitrospira sp.]
MTFSFRFLDDVALADMAFEADGDSVEALFAGATRALLTTLADPATVGSSWERAIERRDADLPQLLFDWLSDIVYWKDAAGVVFHDAPLALAREEEQWVLKARLIGAPVDRETQELHNDVKGVTKHLYALRQVHGHWTVRVVLDV